mgnify:FL=1
MEDKLMYRIRSNNSSSYNDEYKSTTSAKDIENVIYNFLDSNYIYYVSKKIGFKKDVLNKNMVTLKSFNSVLEIEREIYDFYKKEIDNAIIKNIISLINQYHDDIYSGLVKIKLSPTTKAIKPVLKTNDGLYKTKKIIGIDTIYLNYTDINDIKLLKEMILEVIDDNFYSSYFDGDDLILSNNNKKLRLDKNVYYLFERIKLNKKRENKNKSKQLRMVI